MILITGGTGLTGSHLLLHLAQSGAPLRAIYRDAATIARTKNVFSFFGKLPLFEAIEWVEADITDVPSLEDAFKSVEQVYHCAALVSFDPKDEEKLRKVNIEGTANMVNLSLAFGVKKFCHVSSIAALGDTKEGETVITEETEWNPEQDHGDYALSKHGGEMEVWRAWQEGLEVMVVNPGVIFGYGFWHQGSGRILESVRKGQYFYTRGTTGIVAVEDIVKAMVLLMQSPVSGERYTVVAENISYERILDILAGAMNKKKPSIYATSFLTSIAWRMDWLVAKFFTGKRTFTRSMARSSHTQESFDNGKIVRAVNFKFTPMQAYLANLAKQFISQAL